MENPKKRRLQSYHFDVMVCLGRRLTELCSCPEACSIAGEEPDIRMLEPEDHEALRNSIASYLNARYDEKERRELLVLEPTDIGRHWNAFANELGLLSLGFPERVGGLGGGAAEHALVMEQFGASLVAAPYLATAVIGGAFLKCGTLESADAVMRDVIAGTAVLAFAHGEDGSLKDSASRRTRAIRHGEGFLLNGSKTVVLGGAWATHLIVSAGIADCSSEPPRGVALFFVESNARGVSRRDYRTISGGVASDIRFDGVGVPASKVLADEDLAPGLIEAVLDEAIAILCAEALGVMTRLLSDTVAYTKQRQQFGHPLASYQALQHRMADMLIMKEQSAAITREAIAALSGDSIERAKMTSAAKAFVGKSLRFVGQQAVQLHGGMGLTDELAVSSFFKRATEIERQFGSSDYHLARYERLAYGEAVDA